MRAPGLCVDCHVKATHGRRCAKCRGLHAARQRRYSRERTQTAWLTSYLPRKCSQCGSAEHDARLCGRIEIPEPETWLFV